MKLYLLPFIILINLLFPDEIYYSITIFGIENKKIIKDIGIIEMKNNRLYYFHSDNFKIGHLSCSVLNSIKLKYEGSEIIYQPECSSSKRVKRVDMLGIEVIENELGLDEKQIQYNLYKKNPKTAVLLSLLFPSLGHAYAGNWIRGTPFLVGELISFMGASIVLIQSGIGSMLEAERGNSVNSKGTYDAALWLLFIGASISIWEKIDAYVEVEKYNNHIYKDIFEKEPPIDKIDDECRVNCIEYKVSTLEWCECMDSCLNTKENMKIKIADCEPDSIKSN